MYEAKFIGIEARLQSLYTGLLESNTNTLPINPNSPIPVHSKTPIP